MLVIMAATHKKLVRKANREDLDQTASSELIKLINLIRLITVIMHIAKTD